MFPVYLTGRPLRTDSPSWEEDVQTASTAFDPENNISSRFLRKNTVVENVVRLEEDPAMNRRTEDRTTRMENAKVRLEAFLGKGLMVRRFTGTRKGPHAENPKDWHAVVYVSEKGKTRRQAALDLVAEHPGEFQNVHIPEDGTRPHMDVALGEETYFLEFKDSLRVPKTDDYEPVCCQILAETLNGQAVFVLCSEKGWSETYSAIADLGEQQTAIYGTGYSVSRKGEVWPDDGLPSLHGLLCGPEARVWFHRKYGREGLYGVWNPSDLYVTKAEKADEVYRWLHGFLQGKGTLEELNTYLREQHDDGILTGVSLKKKDRQGGVSVTGCNLTGAHRRRNISLERIALQSMAIRSVDGRWLRYKTTQVICVDEDTGERVSLDLRIGSSIGTVSFDAVRHGIADSSDGKVPRKMSERCLTEYGIQPLSTRTKRGARLQDLTPAILEILKAGLPGVNEAFGCDEDPLGNWNRYVSEVGRLGGSLTEGDLQGVGLWPETVKLLLLLARSKRKGRLEDVLDFLIGCARKETVWSAPFLKVH